MLISARGAKNIDQIWRIGGRRLCSGRLASHILQRHKLLENQALGALYLIRIYAIPIAIAFPYALARVATKHFFSIPALDTLKRFLATGCNSVSVF